MCWRPRRAAQGDDRQCSNTVRPPLGGRHLDDLPAGVSVETLCVRRCCLSSVRRWTRATLRLRIRDEPVERRDSLVAAVCVFQDRQQRISQYHNRALVHLQFNEPPVPT